MPDPIDYGQMLADALRNPEAFKAQFGNANRSFDTEDTLIQQQLAQAQALAGQGNPWAVGPNATAGSAFLGGLADVLRGIGGAQMQTGAQTKLQQLAPQKDAAKLDKLRLDFATGRMKAADELKQREAGQHGGMQLVVGADGQYYYVDPRNPAAPAKPVVGPNGASLSKPKPAVKPPKPAATPRLSSGDKDKFQELTDAVTSIDGLASKFKDEYAGDSFLGGAKTTVGQVLGAAAPKPLQERTAFWADFKMLLDLPQRNKTFGSSLSASEKASWESAKNIREGADPSVVRSKFSELSQIAHRHLNARKESAIAEGYVPEAVEALSRTGGTTVPAVAPRRVKMQDGTIWEEQPDGTAKQVK
jgi:hypothetical protein